MTDELAGFGNGGFSCRHLLHSVREIPKARSMSIFFCFVVLRLFDACVLAWRGLRDGMEGDEFDSTLIGVRHCEITFHSIL